MTSDTYQLIDADTDTDCGEFDSRRAASLQARKLRLGAYEIWHDDRRVEFCDHHPDDIETPEDTPSLDDHPFSPASVRFESGE
jgi:hypothetical protein